MKLGRYEVVRELGKGAMGIVYLAKDPLIGRLVALKTIRAAAHADDEEAKEFQQRFVREAQAAGILNHPAIVTVHDIGQDDASGVSFIAMEYVEGQNIKEVLAQGRALSFDQIGDLISQVAEALDFAHSKGIVHRDVKPANIIVLDGNRAKITDFGIAKFASGQANLTSTGQFLGTPNYMAPEQIKGAPVDGRTDIFSLGICLYECLTRRKPFGGDSLTSISYKIVHEPFPPLHEINPQIPEGFEEVVANCLAKDPPKRYQRARDLANALRQVVRGERPVRLSDPGMADDTIVTRDRDKVMPTLEVPFPEAAEVSMPGGAARTSGAAAAAAAAQIGVDTRPTGIRTRPAMRQQLRKTLTNGRALPLWRRRVPPAIFIGITAFLVAGLIGAVVFARSRQLPVPVVDTAAEARHAREKQLRQEGEALLREGRVTDAYAKFEDLSRLAPRSPYVRSRMQKLSAIRQQEEISKQQLNQAQLKFQEGVLLFNQKKYPEAIQRLQESFSLNPNAMQTAEFLRLAQIENTKVEAAKAARAARQQQPGVRPQPTGPQPQPGPGAGGGPGPASVAPSQLNTVFAHPFTDGRIIVRAGGEVVANAALFEERPARVFRRASRAPRPINITQSLAPKNADLQIWVTVPNAGVQEQHSIPAVRFQSGTTHKLIIRYDPASKRFSYELN